MGLEMCSVGRGVVKCPGECLNEDRLSAVGRRMTMGRRRCGKLYLRGCITSILTASRSLHNDGPVASSLPSRLDLSPLQGTTQTPRPPISVQLAGNFRPMTRDFRTLMIMIPLQLTVEASLFLVLAATG